MSRRFLMKDIALQAGVGLATVDRVLNGRSHVHEHTRRRVQQAINELERQQFQQAASGRKLVIDVLVEAPQRFSHEIRNALEAELPNLRPAVVRPRFTVQETMINDEVVAALDAMGRRGSHGVLLKARNVPAIAQAVDRLQLKGIPVVTVFTDIPLSQRIAYAGLDNRMAGATAAYLIGQWLDEPRGQVLITMSDDSFRGEQERKLSFLHALRTHYPKLEAIDASGGHGLDEQTEARVRKAVARRRQIVAVYSMGGGNIAILKALEAAGKLPQCFIAHDLDQDNRQLLRERRISAVLQDDLRLDLRTGCHHLMHYHKLLPASAIADASAVMVVTPENMPQGSASMR